jgi:hypothetical protein
MNVTIRRISLSSLAKFGCLLGAVAASLPSLLCGLATLAAARVLSRWMASWEAVKIRILGNQVATLDLQRLLGLDQLAEILGIITSASGAALVLWVLVLALVSGLLLALVAMLVGLGYNTIAKGTGGLVIEMSAQRDTPNPE